MQWQKIETAPKGERVDLWAMGERLTDCWWCLGYTRYDDDVPKDCWVYMDGDFCREAEEATHWMPLPPPPQGA